jgi:hypothetical protein
MSEEYLISQAAPTLAGLKTGNLFPCSYSSWSSLLKEIRAVKRLLSSKGLCLIPLRHRNNRALLYLYRPARLAKDLSETEAAALLRREGYSDLRHTRCLAELICRLQRFEEFPHEIGLFLSYPPEDVRGFMEHAGRGCKCVGCWKVYGGEQKARNTFRAYKHCTDCYRARGAMGTPLERLAVADNNKA